MTNLQPDTAAVLQEEEDYASVLIPVCVKEVAGPVRVQELPRKAATSRTVSVGTTAVQVLFANHWRSKATLMAMDQNILVAFSQAAAQDPSTMSVWPKLVPLPITATVEVWVASATTTTALSITSELWAEGE